jgi:glycolate oxidase iron-sulfur subunit
VRGLLPEALKNKVPARQDAGSIPTRTHARKMLMLSGCVQPSMLPNVNSATVRVLDAAGIQVVTAAKAGCCGAVKLHMNDHTGSHIEIKRNIDAWWPLIVGDALSAGVEAIVMNASGCGVTVKDYGHILKDDPVYAEKAAKVSALTRDLSELLPELAEKLSAQVAAKAGQVAFHPPCTLQHGQQLRGGVEQYLTQLGFNIRTASCEAHLCCGSAGTYSVLQPKLAYELRDRKLGNLQEMAPEVIVSANVGCITHLQSGTATPVRHWVELLDDALTPV